MKRISALFILLCFFTLKSFSITEKVRIGFTAAPGICWAKPFGKDLNKGKVRFGIDYGFAVEWWFAKNYGLSTGIRGNFNGFNVGGRDAFMDTVLNTTSVNEKYTFNYIEIPLYLKLKTNAIRGGKFKVFGELGITLDLAASSRATYSRAVFTDSVSSVSVEKENILKKNNEVTKLIPGFWSNFIDVRLGGGLGFEYGFDDKTSLLVGAYYHNGFINTIFDHDAKKEAIVMRFVSLKMGVLF